MAKIAFILLTHKDPEGVIAQAERLTSTGDFVAIHYDKRSPRADYERITNALERNPQVIFAKRFNCGWGEWSLVEATLAALRGSYEAFPEATHFYLLSGDCMPTKSAQYAHQVLDDAQIDYIESFDFMNSGWIKTGIKQERLIYRHFFNERKQKWLFYRSMQLQAWLGLEREIPHDIEMMIGSQWWCLRRSTVGAVLEFCAERPDVMRFFRTTWIPDETFFQTIVRHVVPEKEINPRTLTFLMFTDYGMPVTFYNDHHDLLLGQDFFFARKISPEARALKARLGDLWRATGVGFTISGEGRNLFAFLTGRGRIGRRFAPRVWETEASIGRDRDLLMIVCKKWHVAKRLVEQVSARTGIAGVEYLFNEESCPMPDLGGIERTIAQRNRHRRTLMRLIYDHFGADKLMICLDPAELDLMRDFIADRARVRVLEVECEFSDAYLIGHARRVGLAGESTAPEVLDRMLPTVRADFRYESERLRDQNFPQIYRLREAASLEANASALAAFLGVDPEAAREIAGIDYLFVD